MMTWLELYNMLHQKANDINNLDSKFWQSDVSFHNLETGDEHPCDTWEITDQNQEPRLVLGINFSQEEL
jgi:hypothetical protein